jgi:hypothetical protein
VEITPVRCHHGDMRWLSLFAAAVLAGLAIASVSGATRIHASIWLRGTAPVTVGGSHFRGREWVHVTSSAGGSASVRATPRGSFTVRLHGGQFVDRCSGLTVRASGNAGSRAVFRRAPLRACLPAGMSS